MYLPYYFSRRYGSAIEVSRRVVLLADSAKAQTTAPALVCSLSTVDLLITDTGLGGAARRALGGLSIHRVPAR